MLNSIEAKQLNLEIQTANKGLQEADLSKAKIDNNQKSFMFEVPLKTKGYGRRALYWKWWGAEVWLTKDDTKFACQSATGVTGALMTLIPGMGWSIAGILGGALANGVCQYGIGSGIIVGVTWTRTIIYFKWQ